MSSISVLTLLQVIAIRALYIPPEGPAKYVETLVHRYEDGGGIDVPMTSSSFTVAGRYHDERGFARDLRVTPIWRGYTVHVTHPAQTNNWAGEVLVFKMSCLGKSFVNIRKEDRRSALKVVRRCVRRLFIWKHILIGQ